MTRRQATAEVDDLYRHRMALACMALAEVPVTTRSRLSPWVDRLTSEAYAFCRGPISSESRKAIEHLKPLIVAAGRLNGHITKTHLLDLLLHQLESDPAYPDPSDAARWLTSMGDLAATPEVIRTLMRMLGNRKVDSHASNAGIVLGGLGESVATKEVVARLLQVCSSFGEEGAGFWADRHAVVALGHMGTAAATDKAIETLVGLARNRKFAVKAEAVSALGNLGAAAAREDVLQCLLRMMMDGLEDHSDLDPVDDTVELVEYDFAALEAAQALCKLAEAAGPEAFINGEALERLFRIIRRCDCENHLAPFWIAENVAPFLAGNRAAEVSNEIAGLLLTLKRSSRFELKQGYELTVDWERREAARTLDVWLQYVPTAPEVVDVLVWSLQNDPDPEIRKFSARSLGRTGMEGAARRTMDALLLALNGNHDVPLESETDTSPYAVGGSGQLQLPLQVTSKGDSSELVREAAATALGQLGFVAEAPEVAPALAWSLRNDPNVRVREAAASALGELGSSHLASTATDALISALNDGQDSLVTVNAARALGKLNSNETAPQIVRALLRFLRDSLEGWLGEVVEALGKLGSAATEDVIQCLLQALADSGAEEHASRALAHLGERAARADVVTALIAKAQGENHRFILDFSPADALVAIQSITPNRRIFPQPGRDPHYEVLSVIKLATLPPPRRADGIIAEVTSPGRSQRRLFRGRNQRR